VPPKLYHELALWWPLLSAPADYAEEAACYTQTLLAESLRPVRTLLELGCGGGNNASHMKSHFQMTLTDLSAEMLAVSRTLNPECEHVHGDMRTLRLGRLFDAVFIHDAIMYMTTHDDLRAAMTTAFAHCAPGGIAVFVPDGVRETFRPYHECGGHDGKDRSLRYLEWVWNGDPNGNHCQSDFVYLLRTGNAPVQVVADRHVFGLFGREEWLALLADVGFQPRVVPFTLSDAGPLEMFVGSKPRNE
jgi:SAM-dependent methyltransferase